MRNKHFLLFFLFSVSLVFIQCQCSDGPTEPPKDTTRPTVLSTLPVANAVDIPINDSVVIYFSEKILSSSITTTTVSVANSTPTVSVSDSVVVIKFTATLNYSTTYTVIVSTDVTDLSGNKLASSFTFSFTTEADPTTIPPVVVSTYPTNAGKIVSIDDSITVTFTKAINPATLNDTTFVNTNGRTGTISYNASQKMANFKPASPLAYDSTYTMNLTTLIQDTDGNNLQSLYSWTFSTPTVTPSVNINKPSDSIIISDTTTFVALASNPIGIDSVQFYVNNSRVGVGYSGVAEFLYNASALTIGAENSMYAVAYDSVGNFGYSDTVSFFYLWEEVFSEGNDGYNQLQVPNDLRKMFVRSTDSTLELRYEYGYNWTSAYSDTSCLRVYNCGSGPDSVYCSDTAVDLGIFLDTDLNINTGRQDAAGEPLNDIGAEYRIILGLHGGTEALSSWNSGLSSWSVIYDTTGFKNHNIPQNNKIMEIGFLWTDIGNPLSVNIVNVNVFFRNFCDPGDFLSDFMPDRSTNSHVNVRKQNRYFGPQAISTTQKQAKPKSQTTITRFSRPNPFD